MKKIWPIILILALVIAVVLVICLPKNSNQQIENTPTQNTQTNETIDNNTENTEGTENKEESEFDKLNQGLTKEEKEYYEVKENDSYEKDEYTNNKNDMNNLNSVTTEDVKNKPNKVSGTKTPLIDEFTGEEYYEESVYTHVNDGSFDNLKGEYCYIIDENNNITLKNFQTTFKVHLQTIDPEFVLTEDDKQKNEEMIESVMNSIKNFKNTHEVNGFTYTKYTFEKEQNIELPSLQSIKQDFTKMLTVDENIYKMKLYFPTPDFMAIYEITVLEPGMISLTITTQSYA